MIIQCIIFSFPMSGPPSDIILLLTFQQKLYEDHLVQEDKITE